MSNTVTRPGRPLLALAPAGIALSIVEQASAAAVSTSSRATAD